MPEGATLDPIQLHRLGGGLRSWLPVRWTRTAALRPPGGHSLRSRHSRAGASAPASSPSLAVPQRVRIGRAPRRKRRIDPLGARALRQRPPGDRLTAPPPRGGFGGKDLLALSEEEMCAVRGKEISMIFQEPMTSLNPVLTIGKQVSEAYTAHGTCWKEEAAARAREWLRRVKMPDPERRMREYPHQMSGGMRQRGVDGGGR